MPSFDSMPPVTCDFCGKVFTPHADSFLEGGIEVGNDDHDPSDAWKGSSTPDLSTMPQEVRAKLQRMFGLDDDQLREFVTTGKIEGIGHIVCDACQGSDEAVMLS